MGEILLDLRIAREEESGVLVDYHSSNWEYR